MSHLDPIREDVALAAPAASPAGRKGRKSAMVTGDPIKTAVERAWAGVYGAVTVHDEGQRRIAAAAAREALVPVRAWFEANCSLADPDFGALTELIFASEELDRG